MDFKYDVLRNRIEKSVDADGAGSGTATVTKFAYENGNAWADLDTSGSLTTRRMYLGGLDSLFARIDSQGDVAWYLEDFLGSVRDMVDDTGTLQNHIDYDSWGNVTYESNASFGDRYKYTQREWEAELDLQYNRARFYDPHTRRWISQDPLGFDAGDSNLYRYVNNQPTGLTDPSGRLSLFFNGTGHNPESTYLDSEGNETSPLLISLLFASKDPNKETYWFPKDFEDENKQTLKQRVIDPAVAKITQALKANPKEPIRLYGFSRGAVAALLVANELKKANIKVDFLGLLDPVVSGVPAAWWSGLWPPGKAPIQKTLLGESLDPNVAAKVPLNVQQAVVLYTPGTYRTGASRYDEGEGLMKRGVLEATFQRLQITPANNVLIKGYADVGHWDASYHTKTRYDFFKLAKEYSEPTIENPYPAPPIVAGYCNIGGYWFDVPEIYGKEALRFDQTQGKWVPFVPGT